MVFDIDDMELLERLRKKLDLVEAFWWFAENSVDGLCCSNTVNSQKKFEARDAEEVFDLIAILHGRKGANCGKSGGRGTKNP